jgi:hypothetical protein
MKEESNSSLLDRLLDRWTQIVSSTAVADVTSERFCSYRDLDLMCCVPLWKRFLSVEPSSAAHIALVLDKMVSSSQGDSPGLKGTLSPFKSLPRRLF